MLDVLSKIFKHLNQSLTWKSSFVYNDNESTSEDLLTKDNSVLIHYKNIWLLGIE